MDAECVMYEEESKVCVFEPRRFKFVAESFQVDSLKRCEVPV